MILKSQIELKNNHNLIRYRTKYLKKTEEIGADI